MRLSDLQFILPVYVLLRCLAGMFAITLALAGSPLTAIAQSSLSEVVVIPWSAKDITFLRAGPVNSFGSDIFLINSDCEILLDDKKVTVADLKTPIVGELTYSDPLRHRSGHIPYPIKSDSAHCDSTH